MTQKRTPKINTDIYQGEKDKGDYAWFFSDDVGKWHNAGVLEKRHEDYSQRYKQKKKAA